MSTENIQHYFNLLKDIFDEHDLANHPEQIYNIDETGMPLDPKPPKIVARRGQKKVRYSCSGKKGQVTVLGCFNGTGQAQPPFVIFDAQRLNPIWTRESLNSPKSKFGHVTYGRVRRRSRSSARAS